MSLEQRWSEASACLADARDIIDRRAGAEAPSWAIARGWAPFLAALPEDALAQCEVDGLATHAERLAAPRTLRELAADVRRVTALPMLAAGTEAPVIPRVGARKREQVAAFGAAVAERWTDLQRVVDFGAGHGHLTRHLAEALGVEAVGLEREPERVAKARGLAGGAVRFEAVDLARALPSLERADLVVGLHACGALSDRLVVAAAAAGASVAFVSCCLHKRDAARQPLVGSDPAVSLPRSVLGLANIAFGARAIETSLAENVAARGRRLMLRALLRHRGLILAPGDEMRGINRRRTRGPFANLAELALDRRGLEPPSAAEVRRAEVEGAAEQAQHRRWAVARRMLGRVIEVQINLDRAVYLQRRGYRVELGTLWPRAASPRNIAVLARS